jgi:ankyrin repeat protein
MKYIKKFENNVNLDLIQSIRNNDFESFMNCINNGADVNYISVDKNTFPLMEIVAIDVRTKELKDIKYKMMKILLEMGANPNQVDNDDYTPLLIASEPEPYIDMIKLLIDYGADWNSKRGVRDFISVLKNNNYDEYINEIIKKYPEKYKDYLFKKDVEKYNL